MHDTVLGWASRTCRYPMASARRLARQPASGVASTRVAVSRMAASTSASRMAALLGNQWYKDIASTPSSLARRRMVRPSSPSRSTMASAVSTTLSRLRPGRSASGRVGAVTRPTVRRKAGRPTGPSREARHPRPSWRRMVPGSKYTRSQLIRSSAGGNVKTAAMRARNVRPVGSVITERPEVGAEQVELDDDGVVAVVQGDELVALIGERRARPPEVLAHLVLAVEHLTGADELVAGVGEGRHGGLHVAAVLGRHVLADRRLPPRPQVGRRRGRRQRRRRAPRGDALVVRRHEGQAGGPPRGHPADEVGGAVEAEAAQRLRGERRAVALVADDDDPLVEARDGGVVVARRRIDRPLEDGPRGVRPIRDDAEAVPIGRGAGVQHRPSPGRRPARHAAPRA